MPFDLTRRLAAEALGTLFLVMAVVGSGIMAAKLAGGNGAIALLCNTLATGAVLFVIITILAPVSGAHFNPAVSLVAMLRGELDRGSAACLHGGADRRRLRRRGDRASDVRPRSRCRSPRPRATGSDSGSVSSWPPSGCSGPSLAASASSPTRWRSAVGLYITSAYWFTASTSFANPAVTIARSLSDTFAGIAPRDVAPFIVAELLGALAAAGLFAWLFTQPAAAVKKTK